MNWQFVLFVAGFWTESVRSDNWARKRHLDLGRNDVRFYDERLKAVGEDDVDEDGRMANEFRGRGKHTCLVCMAPDCSSRRLCHNAIRCYTAHVRDVDGIEHKSKGCTRNFEHTMLHCRSTSYDGREVHKKNNRSSQYAFECCDSDLCNANTTFPELPPVPVTDVGRAGSGEGWVTANMVLAFVLPILVLLMLVPVVRAGMRRCHLSRMEKMTRNLDFGQANNDCELAGLRAHVVGDSTLREYRKGGDDTETCLTSGSGSGMPRLIRRTLAKQIELIETIGKGRYGEVWRGKWNGDNVAVKIFFSRDEESFCRETKIYSTVLLRHENVLGYYGSDCTSRNSCTQNWLVTHYHPNGSLYDYLNRPNAGLSTGQAFRIIISALTGLVHLHTEINGTKGKPVIAHRDIKSKNILVRNDGNCVIADFGLAVMSTESSGIITEENSKTRVGTRRYMSPEVLDGSIESKQTIEAYKQSDIYSFALVMWEVMRKTRLIDDDAFSADDFALPYHADVGPDPSLEEMYKVVCCAQRRPDIPEKWLTKHRFVAGICNLMKTCWHENPSVRYTGLRLKKSVYGLEILAKPTLSSVPNRVAQMPPYAHKNPSTSLSLGSV